MRREALPPMKTLLATICAMAAAGYGCSDTGDVSNGSGGTPGTGGSGSGLTGGKSATGGQGGTGGSGGSSAQSGGAPATGGTGGTGTGGTGTGGTGTGGTGTGGTGTGGTGTGGTAGTGTGGTGMGGAGTAGSGRGGRGAAGAAMAGTSAGAGRNGGSGNGGSGTAGGGTGGSATGGASNAGRGGKAGGSGGGSTGTCTASQSTGKSVSGSGPHKVVIETNSANGIKCGTIYRPQDLGTEKYPIFVWGEGGCSQDGYSNQAAMGEIASWGYFIVADGTPGSSNACSGGQDGKAFLDYITWAIAENDKSCSAYYQSLDTTKIAADGFSCGGLMSENVSGDARFTAIGITSSGLMSANSALYDKIHTPFKIMNGGSSDIAHDNGARDYDEISKRMIPIIYFSKTSAGHGGDLSNAKGDFNSVNLAWLNWQLKGDTGATGKGFLMGSTCKFCMDSGWEVKSANIQ